MIAILQPVYLKSIEAYSELCKSILWYSYCCWYKNVHWTSNKIYEIDWKIESEMYFAIAWILHTYQSKVFHKIYYKFLDSIHRFFSIIRSAPRNNHLICDMECSKMFAMYLNVAAISYFRDSHSRTYENAIFHKFFVTCSSYA